MREIPADMAGEAEGMPTLLCLLGGESSSGKRPKSIEQDKFLRGVIGSLRDDEKSKEDKGTGRNEETKERQRKCVKFS